MNRRTRQFIADILAQMQRTDRFVQGMSLEDLPISRPIDHIDQILRMSNADWVEDASHETE